MTAEEKIDALIFKQNSGRGTNNQSTGMYFERKNHNKEKQLAVLAMLSAGSRGLIDIVSIRKTHVLLITCKANGYIEPRERRSLEKLRAKLPAFCRLQMRYRVGRKTKKIYI